VNRNAIPPAALVVLLAALGASSGSTGPSLELFAGELRGAGSLDGVGSAASFNLPRGIAADGAGNVYVADTGNGTIRKITPAGVVHTLAGAAGVKGGADAAGAAASFSAPCSLAIDDAGNVYVADRGIRKVTPAGTVTTLVAIDLPQGVARDAAGNVYAADTLNHVIRRIDPAGTVTMIAGTAGAPGRADGEGTQAGFNFPQGLALDGAGNVYVADSLNHTIRKITPHGRVTTLAGTPGASGSADGRGAAASFNFPKGVATDAAGNVYVADTGNSTIRKITPAGAATTLAGAPGVTGGADGVAARFNFPQDVATDGAGNVYVADTLNNVIRKIAPDGVVSTLAGSSASAASFGAPRGIAADGAGNLYVADNSRNTILRIAASGAVTTLSGTAGVRGSADAVGAAASFNFPQGVAADAAGNVYVADTGNHAIRKIAPGGLVSTLAGRAGAFGHADGRGAAASFAFPFGVAADGAGNVYVADTFNNTVRRIAPDGAVTTLAGRAGAAGHTDGAGSEARFDAPRGIATDVAGNVYVAEANNRALRKITPWGNVSTLASDFDAPLGVAADAAGNLYVADGDSYTVRKVSPYGAVSTVVGVAGQPGFLPGPLPGRLGTPQGVAVSGDSLYITLYRGVATVRNRP
jgi:sugar lactone lactonase YvrE